MKSWVAGGLALVASLAASAPTRAETFPNRPLRLIGWASGWGSRSWSTTGRAPAA